MAEDAAIGVKCGGGDVTEGKSSAVAGSRDGNGEGLPSVQADKKTIKHVMAAQRAHDLGLQQDKSALLYDLMRGKWDVQCSGGEASEVNLLRAAGRREARPRQEQRPLFRLAEAAIKR